MCIILKYFPIPKERLSNTMRKSKFLILMLVIAMAVTSLTACKLFGKKDEATDIYSIANNSTATAITTSINYAAANGDEFSGWYVAKRDGNNMIIEYEFDRYQTIEESVANQNTDRIVSEAGVVYYLDGKYYDSYDESKTPWVDAPLDVNFKFNIQQEKLSGISAPSANTLYATMTPEACLEMFGVEIDCEGSISLYLATNGVQITEMKLVYTTDSGAVVNVFTTYSYNDLVLDFTPVTGESEEEAN